MKIVIAEPDGFPPEARAMLEGIGKVVEGPFDRAGLADAAGDADILIVRLAHRIDRELLDATGRLRAICSATTGLDHIDLRAAAERGVEVISLRGETDFLRGITATAEHTWALILALARRLPEAVASGAQGRWDRDRLRGRSLAGKSLGIVGFGRVGGQVAAFGRAFGMRVSTYTTGEAAIPDDVTRLGSLLDLARASDVLTIHVPLSDATRGLIDAEVMSALPPGALIVNTSRGAIVDEAALLEALEDGRLAGAALDVLTAEPDEARLAADPLVRHAASNPNLLITPHVAGATFEAMAATESFVTGRLVAFLEGEAHP